MSQNPDDDLFTAVLNADTASIKSLIAEGADPNSKPFNGKTLLNVAISLNDLEIIYLLLKLGADPTLKNLHDGQNSLHAAIEFGSDDMLNHLLKNFTFDLEDKTVKEETVLHIAANKGFVQAVECLIALGADPFALDRDKRTPQRAALLQSAHRLDFGRPDFIECARLLADHEVTLLAQRRQAADLQDSADTAIRSRNNLQSRSGSKFRLKP